MHTPFKVSLSLLVCHCVTLTILLRAVDRDMLMRSWACNNCHVRGCNTPCKRYAGYPTQVVTPCKWFRIPHASGSGYPTEVVQEYSSKQSTGRIWLFPCRRGPVPELAQLVAWILHGGPKFRSAYLVDQQKYWVGNLAFILHNSGCPSEPPMSS
jgi:hypothetical protein